MANNVDFKYLNRGTSDPICGLTINYSVRVIAVLSNNKESVFPPQPRGAVLTTEVILDGVETTDVNGIVSIDVTQVFSDNVFLEIFQKFSNTPGYNVSIEILLISEQQEIGPYMYISQKNIPIELSAYNVIFSKENNEYEYPDLEYWSVYNSFNVDEIVIDAELLEAIQSKKIRAQRSFLEFLEDFQSEIVSQAPLQIPVLNEYDPINITQIITRCLELNVGTIENALAYTRDAGLIAETNRLNKINTLIGQISNLYPTITIEDGEGLPYQNVGVIPDIFRGFGFYQKNGEIMVQAYVFGQSDGRECSESPIEGGGIKKKQGSNVSIDVNGTVVASLSLEFDGTYSFIDTNLTRVFNDKFVTLVPGDIVTMSVFFNCQNYYTKLIIKN